MLHIISGTKCRACGGLLEATAGDEYVCQDCGRSFEVTDMYMP